jgi:hypothetical protein
MYTQDDARKAMRRNPFLMPTPEEGEWYLLDTKTDTIIGGIMNDEEQEEHFDLEWAD